jgi:hypothetical protein
VALFQRFTFQLDDTHHPGGQFAFKSVLASGPKDGLWVNVSNR